MLTNHCGVVAPAGPDGVVANIEGPVVLAGHSYGGTVISNAAVGLEDKVKALVYNAAFLPDTGESTLGLSNQFPGSTLMSERAHARTVEVEASHAVSVSRPDAVSRIIQQAATTTSRGA